jgi:hypothetical protein
MKIFGNNFHNRATAARTSVLTIGSFPSPRLTAATSRLVAAFRQTAEKRRQTAGPFYQAAEPFRQTAGRRCHLAEQFCQTAGRLDGLAESICQLAESFCQAAFPAKSTPFPCS